MSVKNYIICILFIITQINCAHKKNDFPEKVKFQGIKADGTFIQSSLIRNWTDTRW